MPRNAAKKTNKNAKRLPVLIKLTNLKNINNNKKKKVNNSNKNNNSNSFNNNSSNGGSKNIINTSSNNNNNNNSTIKDTTATKTTIKKHKKRRQNIRKKNAIVNATFTGSKQQISSDNNCDANNIKSNTDKLEIATALETSTPEKVDQTNVKVLDQQQSFKQNPQKSILNYFVISDNKPQLAQEILNKPNNFNINKLTVKETTSSTSSPANLSLTLLSTTANCSSPSSLTSTSLTTAATPPLTSPNSTSQSTLYPIVIETSESFLKHENDYAKDKIQTEENNLNIKKNKIHSIYNCCNNNSNNNNNNNIIKSTCCHIAVDTLKQQQQKSQNNNNKNLTTSPLKRNNNNNKQQKQTTSSTDTTNQSQEVKARLATLRTRKKVLQQEQQQKQQISDKANEQKEEKTNCSVPQPFAEKDTVGGSPTGRLFVKKGMIEN